MVGCKEADEVEQLADGWVAYESEPVYLTDEYNMGCITLRAADTGVGGTVLFDDVVLEEYKEGRLINTLNDMKFDSSAGAFYLWSADGSGVTYYDNENGYGGGGCIAIADTTSDANITGYQFALKEGCEYRIRAKMKQLNTECEAMPRIDFSLTKKLMTLNEEYLEEDMKQFMAFGIKNNVPLYLGEFGAAINAFKDDRGGERWVEDMLEICLKYQIHFSYHAYHESTFGLYMNMPYSLPAQKNEKLEAVFKKMLLDETPEEPIEPSPGQGESVGIKVETTNSSSNNVVSSINNTFTLNVVDEKDYDLSKLKIRYYFTSEGATTQNCYCDNAAINYSIAPWYTCVNDITKCNIVKMDTPVSNADSYLEIGFEGNTVLNKTGTLTLTTRIAKSDWTQYTQDNDLSHNMGAALYYDDVLINDIRP